MIAIEVPMGRHAIVDKLDGEFNKGISSQAQVVYVLVEIRKLIEMTHRTDQYLTLVFYCEWALHSRLDRTGALRLLQKFDNYCDSYINAETNHGKLYRVPLPKV